LNKMGIFAVLGIKGVSFLIYILLAGILGVWLILLIRTKKLTWHSIVNVYTLAVMLVDIPEVIFNKILSWYKFPTYLASAPELANHLGILFADGIILPFGAIILMFYIGRYGSLIPTIVCIAAFIALELVFLKYSNMQYNNWNILASACFYTVGIGIFAYFASRYIDYNPPIPYGVRIVSIVYTANAWLTAILNPLLNLYQWKLGVLDAEEADRVVFELWTGLGLGVISALIIPRTSPINRAAIFLCLAFLATGLSWYLHLKGVLIYHKWNNSLMAIRYFVPFILTIWYDVWETKYQNCITNSQC
jgi:hypothetical protein